MSLVSCLVLPSAWVALEYARSHLFSGFGWNLLAYSQTRWLPVIQVADLTGAWGVSWLIVAVNTAAAQAAAPRAGSKHRLARTVPLAVAGGLVVAAVSYGMWRLPQVRHPAVARVAVVQGNIPQEEKWDEAQRESILARYETLTREAARSRPQLIVWPETAAPGYLNLEELVAQRVTSLARAVGIPMLVGAPMAELDGLQWRMTNSAALLDAAGELRQRYDKLHLVPFGEFVPGERWLPWLRGMLPPIGDFVPGREYTVFHLGSRFEVQGSRLPVSLEPSTLNLEPAFSVLICFEDIFPELARRFVQHGARLLLVITNDGWFGPTAAAYQHAQASTFRAVELRVPVARAANTGWSGCIEPSGRWTDRVRDASGRELFVPGTATCELPDGQARSLYLRLGDWFAWGCVIVVTGWLVGWYNQSSPKWSA